jgi:hypothetical protein
LILKFEGFEFCKWIGGPNANIIDQLRYQNFKGDNQIYYKVHVLNEFVGGVRMGFYAFPFAIRIPMDVPGSLITNQANIKYILSSYLSHVVEPVQDSMMLPHASCFVNVT